MNVYKLIDLAEYCRKAVIAADSVYLEIDDGSIVDLCADQCATGNWPYHQPPLDDIRDALVVAGLAPRFPKATAKHKGDVNERHS